jgi:hypothetical protein
MPWIVPVPAACACARTGENPNKKRKNARVSAPVFEDKFRIFDKQTFCVMLCLKKLCLGSLSWHAATSSLMVIGAVDETARLYTKRGITFLLVRRLITPAKDCQPLPPLAVRNELYSGLVMAMPGSHRM